MIINLLQERFIVMLQDFMVLKTVITMIMMMIAMMRNLKPECFMLMMQDLLS